MVKVYFVRHGKTEYNIKKIIQGDIDVPLSDIGREEIRKFKSNVDDIDYNIYINIVKHNIICSRHWI